MIRINPREEDIQGELEERRSLEDDLFFDRPHDKTPSIDIHIILKKTLNQYYDVLGDKYDGLNLTIPTVLLDLKEIQSQRSVIRAIYSVIDNAQKGKLGGEI